MRTVQPLPVRDELCSLSPTPFSAATPKGLDTDDLRYYDDLERLEQVQAEEIKTKEQLELEQFKARLQV